MAARVTPLNKLLAALPPDIYKRLDSNLELVPLVLGASVYEAGGRQAYVYFPTDAIVSLLYVMKDGASAEIAIVGNEGLVGIALFMGGGDHAQPRRRSERRSCLPAELEAAEARIRKWRR